MKRLAAATNTLAFIVTTLFLLLALALLVTSPGGPRHAIPELTLLGVALVAFLLAAFLAAMVEQPVQMPVEVRVEDKQVDLFAAVVDGIMATQRAAAGLPKPIPQLPVPYLKPPVVVEETKLPRHRART